MWVSSVIKQGLDGDNKNAIATFNHSKHHQKVQCAEDLPYYLEDSIEEEPFAQCQGNIKSARKQQYFLEFNCGLDFVENLFWELFVEAFQ